MPWALMSAPSSSRPRTGSSASASLTAVSCEPARLARASDPSDVRLPPRTRSSLPRRRSRGSCASRACCRPAASVSAPAVTTMPRLLGPLVWLPRAASSFTPSLPQARGDLDDGDACRGDPTLLPRSETRGLTASARVVWIGPSRVVVVLRQGCRGRGLRMPLQREPSLLVEPNHHPVAHAEVATTIRYPVLSAEKRRHATTAAAFLCRGRPARHRSEASESSRGRSSRRRRRQRTSGVPAEALVSSFAWSAIPAQ